jgi:hypothetical protein
MIDELAPLISTQAACRATGRPQANHAGRCDARLFTTLPILIVGMDHHPDADLAVLLSDVLHQFTVRDGESGLDPTDFTPFRSP